MFRPLYTSVFIIFYAISVTPSYAASPEAAALAAAYEDRASGNWDAARGKAIGLGRDVIEWHRLRAGEGTFAEYQDFLSRNADWPGLPLLARYGESAITDDADPRAVIDYLSAYPPATGAGALRLIKAYETLGAKGDAAASAVIAWRELPLSETEASSLYARYTEALPPHHTARAEMLLWSGRYDQAAQVAGLLPNGWTALVTAVRTLAKDEDGVDAAIKAVPDALQSHPVLAYARFEWRVRKGRADDAVTLMLQHSSSAEALGEPEAWGDRRRSLARQMMREGKARIAYTAAARHFLTPDQDHYADLEWLAGYIALRYLDEPTVALEHFNQFRMSVGTPISLGRAGYWEGRALEAMGAQDDAMAAYTFGAQFQTSFYGLLSAERAGIDMDPALTGESRFDDYAQATFMGSSVLKSAKILYESGDLPLAARFMRHLAETLTPQEMGQLGDLALDTDPYLAVLVAKYAADQGIVLNRAYYPLHDLATGKLPVSKELALSIARRESEFNAMATSYVGARGLMQLMPRTGAAMAEKVGLAAYDVDDLYSPSVNAQLGSTYLAQLIEEFGANMPLVAAGYNAGPSRARAWIEAYGDPRTTETDAIDWIEHIPFRETRNYVMRVMESIPVYRARLNGDTHTITLSQELKAR